MPRKNRPARVRQGDKVRNRAIELRKGSRTTPHRNKITGYREDWD